MLKIALSFATGILCKYLGIPYLEYLGLGCISLFILSLYRDKHLFNPHTEYAIGLSLVTSFMSLGYMNLAEKVSTPTERLAELSCKNLLMAGTVLRTSQANDFGQSIYLEVFAAKPDSIPEPIQAKILCRISPQFASNYFQNDTLFVSGYLTPFQSPHSSYKEYLAKQDINYALYADTLSRGSNPKGVLYWGTNIQYKLNRKIRECIPSQVEQEIALAMFLGDKKALSQSTRDPFVIAGASHILAISGMHIGIVFLLLNVLLGFIHFFPQGKQVKNLIILILLLFYMLLTGLSPAVVRATLMFGLILLFRIFFVRFHILNIIGTSALIQLTLYPKLLINPGFQLSYSAVLGIVILFPWVEKNCFTPWKALNYFYAWIGISLCASIATAPLVWYHFGSFPVYFVLTNLLTSALSVLIVWVGFLLVLCLYIPLVSGFLGLISQYLLGWLFEIVSWIAQLPYAQLREPSLFSPPGYLLIGELGLSLVILFLPYLIRRRKFFPRFLKFDPSFAQVHR